jgi:hypothetical protein
MMTIVAAPPEWLKVEAYSNYLVFGAGLIVGLLVAFVRYFFRKRSRIEAARTKQGELFHYSADVADALNISYRGKDVKELHGTELVFRNLGSTTLENIRLHFALFPECERFNFLEFSPGEDADPERRRAISVTTHPFKDGEAPLELFIPYLNGFSDHSDVVTLKIYSDRAVNVARLRGSGVGWSVKYIDKYGLWKNFETEMVSNSSFLNAAYWTATTLIKRFKG